MKPQLHQKATFYPFTVDPSTPASMQAVVTRVWGDTCVNLDVFDIDGQLHESAYSVPVYDPTSGQPKPTTVVYCVLEAVAEAEVEHLVQPKITGYRQLSEGDAVLMNEIKAQGEVMSALITKVAKHLAGQHVAGQSGDADMASRHTVSEPQRWMAMARSDLQMGLMKLTRAVAQPSSF